MASPRPTSFPLNSTSSLPFPKSLRHNKSFVRLANLLGLGSEKAAGSFASVSGSGSGTRSDEGIHVDVDEEDGEEEEEDGAEVDEESLMWDAQVSTAPSLATCGQI